MGALKLALPSTTHRHVPPFNYSLFQNSKKAIKTNLHIQLLLRRPKQTIDMVKLQTQPETVNSKPITNGGSWRIDTQKAKSTNCTTSDILRLMDSLCLAVPPDIYSSLVKECTDTRDVLGALELQAHIASSGVRPTVSLLNRLLVMHVSCGQVDIARQLFDKMIQRDFYSWAIVILGYIEVGDYHEAMVMFATMMKYQSSALKLQSWIMGCVLKACVLAENLALGKQVHSLCLKLGYVSDDLYLSGSLIRFYGKFRRLDDANFVLDQLSRANTVVWAAKITNDYREGLFDEVIHDFNTMSSFGIKKNVSVFSSVLKASARIGDDGRCGRQVHANAIKLGFEADGFVHCGLVDMYGKCGLVRDSKRVFEEVADKSNVACWNAMVMGYMQNGLYVDAIKVLYQMEESGMEVQETFFNDVRIACGSNDYMKAE